MVASCAIAALYFYLPRGSTHSTLATTSHGAVGSNPAPLQVLHDEGDGQASTTAPWAQVGKVAASAASAGDNRSSAQAKQDAADKRVKILEAVQQLRKLEQSGGGTSKQIEDAFRKLELANGSPVMNGVHLDVFRQNIIVLSKMRALGEDIRAISDKTPKNKAPSPELMAQLKTKLAQLEDLRNQLRLDAVDSPTANTFGENH